ALQHLSGHGHHAHAQGVRGGGGGRRRLRQRRHRGQLPDRPHRSAGRQLRVVRLQGRHRVPDHDRGAALAAAGSLRPPDRDLMRRAGWLALGVFVVTVPWLLSAAVPRQQRYILHVLIFTAIFAALALSYDLVVGHVGSLSLAHPAFFGIGAYTAAILATRAGWPFLAGVLGAVIAAAVVAALVGVPLFRLAEHAF